MGGTGGATDGHGFNHPSSLVMQADSSAPKVAVLSDSHIGDRDSLMETQAVQQAVAAHIGSDPGIGTVVLLGDTLDLDFGTLSGSIDGRYQGTDAQGVPNPRLPGLRSLVHAICAREHVKQIIYVVGNHDYAVWDWECTQRHSLQPLAKGQPLPWTPVWCDRLNDAALSGLLPPASRAQFVVAFPHCILQMGPYSVVMTHGHWFEGRQTGYVKIESVADAGGTAKSIRTLAIASAQHQLVVRALAIRRWTRAKVHGGYKSFLTVWNPICHMVSAWRSLRGKPPTRANLRAIGIYLRHIACLPDADAFVYGHTHLPGKWSVPPAFTGGRRAIPAYNCGSFLPEGGQPATMLVLDPAKKPLAVNLVSIGPDGKTSTDVLQSGG